MIPKSGFATLYSIILSNPMTVHLFINEIEPDDNVDLDSFVEVIGGNYSPHVIDPESWKYEGREAYSSGKFKFSEPIGIVYGFYVCINNQLLWFELFEEPFLMTQEKRSLEVGLTLKLH